MLRMSVLLSVQRSQLQMRVFVRPTKGRRPSYVHVQHERTHDREFRITRARSTSSSTPPLLLLATGSDLPCEINRPVANGHTSLRAKTILVERNGRTATGWWRDLLVIVRLQVRNTKKMGLLVVKINLNRPGFLELRWGGLAC